MGNKNKQEILFTQSWFAKMLARNAKYDSIATCESNIKLTNAKALVSAVDFINIDNDISVRKGLIWSTIIISHSNGELFQIGGVGNDIAPFVVGRIKQLSSRYQKQFLEYLKPALAEAFNGLSSLTKSSSYIRKTSINEWLSENQHLRVKITYPVCKRLDEKHTGYIHSLNKPLNQGIDYFEEKNSQFIANIVEKYQDFFNSVESQPLTLKQRQACVVNEKSNLVLAGAGTGKTSVMVGRAGYLIQSEQAEPSEILMLAYASDAKEEMAGRIKNRLGSDDLTVKTFHSLGKEIISKVEGSQPSLNKMAEDNYLKAKFIDEQFRQLIQNSDSYQANLIDYFLNHAFPQKSIFSFKTQSEYIQYIQQNEIRSLNGDLVKSLEECEIANYLAQQGIVYEYEAKFKIDTSGPDYKQYHPDFYLPEYDIYIEHFAVDENNKTPPFINRTEYTQGMEWKRELHKEHGTTLIETYSYQKANGSLFSKLEASLLNAGVEFKPIPKDRLLSLLNKEGVISTLSMLLADLLSLLKSALLTIDDLYQKAKKSHVSAHLTAVLKLFEPIYEAYENELKRTNSIDFDDMIARAIKYIKAGKFQSRYKHILVDEFQDISSGRAQFIKALIQQQDSTLFCVGDDWQSIYRFSGSDISITNNFYSYFGDVAESVLDCTFRFNNKIGEVASKFVTKNPAQKLKDIKSLNQVDNAAVSLIKTADMDKGIHSALQSIQEQVSQKVSVLILTRFRHDKPNIRLLSAEYPLLDINVMTVHASKGKEADYVVVAGLKKGKFGFPSEKSTPALLSLLLPDEQSFQFSEERRLFYVALTRAKHHVYLVTDINKPSLFVRELIDDKYDIKDDLLGAPRFKESLAPLCPQCNEGNLVNKEGQYGVYDGCDSYPVCKYTQSKCQWCSGSLIKRGRFRVCQKASCEYIEPVCPECDGRMIYRSNGKLWGCEHYNTKKEFSCEHVEKYIDLSEADTSVTKQ